MSYKLNGLQQFVVGAAAVQVVAAARIARLALAVVEEVVVGVVIAAAKVVGSRQ